MRTLLKSRKLTFWQVLKKGSKHYIFSLLYNYDYTFPIQCIQMMLSNRRGKQKHHVHYFE